MSCKKCNSLFIQSYTNATHFSSFAIYSNNSFSSIMQLLYNYNHIVMLTSLFIHSSKHTTLWRFLDDFFWNVNVHHLLWLFILDGFKLWHLTHSKVATWHINGILEIKTMCFHFEWFEKMLPFMHEGWHNSLPFTKMARCHWRELKGSNWRFSLKSRLHG
jgi:hypothetical protein